MITLIIICITVGISLLAFSDNRYMSKFIFNPYSIDKYKQWYRFVSSGFIHADYLHLIANMYVLYMFGGILEKYFSFIFTDRATYYFILLYIGGLVTSVIPTFNRNKNNMYYNGLGASGAVSAVVFSFILFNPMERLSFFPIFFIKFPAIVFGVGYLIYCYYMDKKASDNVNHNAHLFGGLFGFFFTVLLKPELLLNFFSNLTSF